MRDLPNKTKIRIEIILLHRLFNMSVFNENKRDSILYSDFYLLKAELWISICQSNFLPRLNSFLLCLNFKVVFRDLKRRINIFFLLLTVCRFSVQSECATTSHPESLCTYVATMFSSLVICEKHCSGHKVCVRMLPQCFPL